MTGWKPSPEVEYLESEGYEEQIFRRRTLIDSISHTYRREPFTIKDDTVSLGLARSLRATIITMSFTSRPRFHEGFRAVRHLEYHSMSCICDTCLATDRHMKRIPDMVNVETLAYFASDVPSSETS